MDSEKKVGLFQRIKSLVAGIIAGSADNDPAAITTYSVAGASTGYSQIWLMVLATPMLIAVQSICARIGDVTSKGLAAVIKDNFPKPIAYISILIIFITTLITIGADLAGVGAAFHLVFGFDNSLWIVPVALAIWFMVLFANFEVITKYLSFFVIFFFSYIISAFLSHPNWGQVAKSFVIPQISFQYNYLTSAVGILGATLTPTLFFWQTKEEVEEKGTDKVKKARHTDLMLAPGFIFGQLIAVFIMIATAATLYVHHIQINTAADAAKSLEPLAGTFAKYLFAFGLIGSGFMAVPVLAASAGYMVAEAFSWRQSLSDKIDSAKGFYIVITLALFVGVEIAVSGIDPIKALFFSQALGGVVGPIFMILLLIIANRKKIMGEYTNRWFDNIFGGLALLVMAGSSILLLIRTFLRK